MTDTCRTYSREQISRYVDGELPGQEMKAVADHLRQCPACREQVEHYQGMAALFQDHVNRQTDSAELKKSQDRILSALSSEQVSSPKWITGLFGKNIYLKLASIVAIVGIGFAAFQGRIGLLGQWTGESGPDRGLAGPSAIIQSVNTDVSSVMIIETEKHKHTIIWFSET